MEQCAVGQLGQAVVQGRVLQARDDLFTFDGVGDLGGHELQQFPVVFGVVRIVGITSHHQRSNGAFPGFERNAKPASRMTAGLSL